MYAIRKSMNILSRVMVEYAHLSGEQGTREILIPVYSDTRVSLGFTSRMKDFAFHCMSFCKLKM